MISLLMRDLTGFFSIVVEGRKPFAAFQSRLELHCWRLVNSSFEGGIIVRNYIHRTNMQGISEADQSV